MKPEFCHGISHKEVSPPFAFVLLCLLALCPPRVLAQYTNFRITPSSSGSPEEVTIAINPTNPLNLVAGANLNFFYYSVDGGSTWKQGNLGSSFGVWGDPCVIFDATGNAYFGHLSGTFRNSNWLDRIVVQKSTDGGKTWNNGAGIGLSSPKQQDKDWLACDLTNSAYRNNLYVAWTEFDKYGSAGTGDTSRILLARSTDAGNTWSPPARVSDQGGNCVDSDSTVEGAVPAIGPNGEVYLSWSGPRGILFDKSTDGGVTFGKDIFVTSQPGGWDLNVPGLQRCNGFPVTCCDVSASPYRGTIYIMWSDQRNGEANTDIFLVKSTDQGATWGAVKRVNDDTTRTHQFFPWMVIDQTTGYLSIVFYDRRTSTGIATDVYLARSTNGGDTFSNTRISQSSFSPTTSYFLGDYIHVVAASHVIHPIWTRVDSTGSTVWTASIIDSVASGIGTSQTIPASFSLSQNFPNPFNGSTVIQFSIPFRMEARLTLFDVLGREVRTLTNGEVEAGPHSIVLYSDDLPSGVYVYRLKTPQYLTSKKLVITK